MAVVGTTSYQYINDNIKPSDKPLVYDTLDANVAALKNGADRRPGHRLPDRLLHRERPALEREARRPFADAGKQEYFGVTFEKGNSLVGCVNKAIEALKPNGKIEKLEQQWITSKAHAPQTTK